MYLRPVLYAATLVKADHSKALEKDLCELERLLAAAEALNLLTPELEDFRQARWPAGRELLLAVTLTNERNRNTDARREQETS